MLFLVQRFFKNTHMRKAMPDLVRRLEIWSPFDLKQTPEEKEERMMVFKVLDQIQETVVSALRASTWQVVFRKTVLFVFDTFSFMRKRKGRDGEVVMTYEEQR